MGDHHEAVGEEGIHGTGVTEVTDEQIQAWADEAERGYDLKDLRRGGHPPRG